MFMPIFRYKSESNSQPSKAWRLSRWRCLCQSLDTSLKAIHNYTSEHHLPRQMFMPIFRYKSESNSQRSRCGLVSAGRCLCQSLDTSLKAIHNQPHRAPLVYQMFMPIFRYKSESNSQRQAEEGTGSPGCLCQSLDTSLKAIHNDAHAFNALNFDVYANL